MLRRPVQNLNKDILLIAIENDYDAYKEASEELKKDRSIALKVIQDHPQVIEYIISEKLINDKDFIKESIKVNPLVGLNLGSEYIPNKDGRLLVDFARGRIKLSEAVKQVNLNNEFVNDKV